MQDEEYINLEAIKDPEKQGWKAKLEAFLESKYFIVVVLVLIAIIAFALGRISGLQDKRTPVRVLNGSTQAGEVKGASNNSSPNPSLISREGSSEPSNTETNSGQVVASKSGTKYHYPWCSGAKQISAKNLITFNSIEEARAKGYTPASNCKGLK
jgi:hypothetical protein